MAGQMEPSHLTSSTKYRFVFANHISVMTQVVVLQPMGGQTGLQLIKLINILISWHLDWQPGTFPRPSDVNNKIVIFCWKTSVSILTFHQINDSNNFLAVNVPWTSQFWWITRVKSWSIKCGNNWGGDHRSCCKYLLFLLYRAWTGFLVINFTFVFTVKKWLFLIPLMGWLLHSQPTLSRAEELSYFE